MKIDAVRPVTRGNASLGPNLMILIFAAITSISASVTSDFRFTRFRSQRRIQCAPYNKERFELSERTIFNLICAVVGEEGMPHQALVQIYEALRDRTSWTFKPKRASRGVKLEYNPGGLMPDDYFRLEEEVRLLKKEVDHVLKRPNGV